ncbi:MAG: cupin domain-containing protein [Alphaproteobacteria bacterium]|nr:cupin domain-containing protein [Alphaproteobacteria bacterium]
MTLASNVETHFFADDGIVPNNPTLPLVLYRGALGEEGDLAARCEAMFDANGWPGAWRNGIYAHHHYHSTAHEVLGIARGSARVRLGGESGATVELRTGDVVVIPAGVAHKRESATSDLLVIGSYPTGQRPDICQAEAAAHDRSAANVARVPLPASDPVTGDAGPLLDCWRAAGSL